MSHAAQLARIGAIVGAVTDVGRVHTWPRFGDAYDHWVTNIAGVDVIRAWEIGLDDAGLEAQRITANHVHHYLSWRIQGYLGLVDEAAAYNTIISLAESIRAGLEADTTLNGTCLEMVGENGGVPDISAPDSLEIGGNHLCWGITIRFTTYEIT